MPVQFKFFNDPQKLWKLVGLLSEGAVVTVQIFFLTLLIAVPLGLLVAQGRMSRYRLLRLPVSFYIYIMRSTPLMLQIMFIYFLLPNVLPFRVDRFWSVVFAFVINYAAYFAEIFRSGIQGIPAGQREAAHMLGYSRPQTFFRIILPQMFKRVLLPVTNEVITLVKDTSLARVILVYEIIWEGQSFIRSDGLIWPLFCTGLFYLAFTGLLTLLFGYLERKLDYFRV